MKKELAVAAVVVALVVALVVAVMNSSGLRTKALTERRATTRCHRALHLLTSASLKRSSGRPPSM